MKRLLKEYRFVFLFIVILGILVLVRTYDHGRFRYDAVRWASPSADGAALISSAELSHAAGTVLFLLPDGSVTPPDIPDSEVLAVGVDSLIEKKNLRRIRRNDGVVVICTEDVSMAAGVWMVLSQTGIRNLYILKKGQT